MDDAAVAATAARRAADLLTALRASPPPDLGARGDAAADAELHALLAALRPGDPVLSEESADDPARLTADRVWIIDPLDGTREYAAGSPEWAVHVALWSRGAGITAAAVALPARGEALVPDPPARPGQPGDLAVPDRPRRSDQRGDDVAPGSPPPQSDEDAVTAGRPRRSDPRGAGIPATPSRSVLGSAVEVVVSGMAATPPSRSDLRIAVSASRPPESAAVVAAAMGARLVPMGSAGVKAMAVVRGEVDAYLHEGGQWEWDSAAPVGVAVAAGLHASRADGSPLVYNQPSPYLPDLLICRPEVAEALLTARRAAISG